MSKEVSANVKAARDILRGQSLAPRAMLTRAKRLKEEKQFGLARRLLARANLEPSLCDEPKLRLEVCQQLALCTYKDPDLQADARLDRALEILRQSCEDITTTINQETLGLLGAIYKRKWELDNQKQQLERSLNYYQRGYQQGAAKDQGYTGINAAFVLDLLARQEEEEADKAQVVSDLAVRRRAQARDIRVEIIKRVAPLVDQPDTNWLQGKWWFYSTVAEAYFGTGEYDTAIEWLERGRDDATKRETIVPAWEYESTARQLASLARLQDGATTATGTNPVAKTEQALTALRRFFGAHGVQSAYVGKIGLALSGGGFRASLFHIGVLARLAELDVLQRVEVLSCVSGGSIIGAHYYLEVRQLLQTVPDKEINKDHYIEIVAKVRRDFLKGVQQNVRVRVAAELKTDLKMIFLPRYTRTMRAGELYEREIFSRVGDGRRDDPCWLNGLYVCPVMDDGKLDEGFNFKTDNWQRKAKVPNLILNATTLNTGHNWQFTASWMGEPPAGIDSEIDGNDRLRRLYYDGEDTPQPHRRVRLGHAVAASACVPGIFEPIMLDALYPERIVRLVDGGVCDNQGVASLLEQDCTVILVSDGSGQMESQTQPSHGILGVSLRSNSILQARVREAQYHELSARKRASLLRGFMFVHLKDDLNVDPIDWIGCLDPYDASDDSRPAYRRGSLTRYGIAKDVQALLAGVRTDLDSFSDLEALALMTSGYRMTEYEFKYSKCIEGFPEPNERHEWDFLAVEEGMKGSGAKYDYLKKQLSASNALAFKIWKLSPLHKVVFWMIELVVVALVILAGVYGIVWYLGLTTAISYLVIILGVIMIALAAMIIVQKIFYRVRLRNSLARTALGVLMLIGWVVARIHLHFFDPKFLRGGDLETFRRVT
jgi:predicted acylesterase/phospholipase RssA